VDALEITPEKWRPVVGQPDYEVSSRGQVRSYKSGRLKVMKQSLSRWGYWTVEFCTNRKRKRVHVHRVELAAFTGGYRVGLDAAHLNGIRTDNRLENLAWATRAENFAHKKLHGTQPLGETHWNASLTEEQVREVRRDYVPRKRSFCFYARKFGVSDTSVRQAYWGKTWGHVK
jgi:hypothetical protein